ncbi:MAG TPA: glycosyltransferase family 4 protein [Acidimicrobiales bacterium]|nr:glycosyltransferase family 4 protein [Acidimicrobiales bacterium]
MPAATIHQFVPMLHRGDAVGRHCLELQRLLRAGGVRSEIYVELDDRDTVALTRPATAYPHEAAPQDVLVYQFATASDLAPWLAARSERLVVNYHNVTPPELFAPWDNGLARHQVRARRELALLASRADTGVGVSEVNRADLLAAGYRETAVIPPIVDLRPPSERVEAPGAGGASKWLAVGRLAPNKAFEDTLVALLAYRFRHDPGATLTVVGRPALPVYAAAVRGYGADLGLADAVTFTGPVSDEGLRRAYAEADVLVVTSEHEGYCLPVVEAMLAGVPVVAFREGAVPEVLGDAGTLLEDKDPVRLADAVARLADPGYRRAQVAQGRARVESLHLELAGPKLVELLLDVARRPAV